MTTAPSAGAAGWLLRIINRILQGPAPQGPPVPPPVVVSALVEPPAVTGGVSAEDLDAATLTVWGEARGEPPEGRRAVAYVIVRRAALARQWLARRQGKARHPLYGDGTLAGACKAPWQFSCWNVSDPNRAKLLNLGESDAVYRECRAAVLSALAQPDADPTRGATHYHTAGVTPAWSQGLTPCVKIGRHLFFNDVP